MGMMKNMHEFQTGFTFLESSGVNSAQGHSQLYGQPTNQDPENLTTMRKSIIPVLGFILAGHAQAAVTIQSSSMTSVGTSYAYITVPKFDTTLGTLTGVEISVAANANGTISLKNAAVSGGNVTVTDISSTLSVRTPPTGFNVGYGSTKNDTISALATTADWSTASLAPQETEIFTINAGQSFAINDVNIDSSFFSYYQGTGNVTFQAKAATTASISGDELTLNTSAAGANVQYSIKYTYDAAPPVSPVPEVGSVIFTGLLLGSGLTVRRRKVRG